MERLAERLRELVVATDAYRHAVAGALGVSVADAVALGELLHAGPLTPSALGRRLGSSSASVTALLDRLEAAGLVARRRNPRDRRSVLVELTAAGESASRRLFAMFRRDVGAATVAAAPEHVAALAVLLERVAAGLRIAAADRSRIAAVLAEPPVPTEIETTS